VLAAMALAAACARNENGASARAGEWLEFGSQNVIFVGSNYPRQGELYRLGLLTTGFCLLVFLVLGTPWLMFVAS
jgi:di/tricarboxylate transporter